MEPSRFKLLMLKIRHFDKKILAIGQIIFRFSILKKSRVKINTKAKHSLRSYAYVQDYINKSIK